MPCTLDTTAVVLPAKRLTDTEPVAAAPAVALAPAARPVSLICSLVYPNASTLILCPLSTVPPSFLPKILATVLRFTVLRSPAPAEPTPAPSPATPTPRPLMWELRSALSKALTKTSAALNSLTFLFLLMSVLFTWALVRPVILLMTTVASTATPAAEPTATPPVMEISRRVCSASALITKPFFAAVLVALVS